MSAERDSTADPPTHEAPARQVTRMPRIWTDLPAVATALHAGSDPPEDGLGRSYRALARKLMTIFIGFGSARTRNTTTSHCKFGPRQSDHRSPASARGYGGRADHRSPIPPHPITQNQ